MDHGQPDKSLSRVCPALVVFTQAPIITQPSECALDNPSLRDWFKAGLTFSVGVALNNVQLDADNLFHPRHQLPGIALVSPDNFQGGNNLLHSADD